MMNNQESVTNVTENNDTQTLEKNEEGIVLTDTTAPLNEGQAEKEGVKTYTEDDFQKAVNDKINEILPKKIEREKSKLDRKYQKELSKYKETESILSAGLKTDDIDSINSQMRSFYESQGIDVPKYQEPNYSENDEKDLGNIDASRIIELGYDDIKSEVRRLTDIGFDKMSVREKSMFKTLAEELKTQDNRKELQSIGVTESDLDNKFNEFAKQFDSNVPITKVWDIYSKVNGIQKEYKPAGSMKTTNDSNKKIKEYYSFEEANNFTREDYDKNPGLLEAVEKSMPLWYGNKYKK